MTVTDFLGTTESCEKESTVATAKDVALRAGTSTAVVSYVFNNGPRNVSEPTRQRVLRAAEALNYQPNALARALSAGKTSSIGLIVPNICNPWFAELARAIEEVATLRGHLLLIGDSAMMQSQERGHVRSFIERKVDSVILVSLLDDPELYALEQAGIPVVVLHPIPDKDLASTLTIDFVEAARTATEHLIEHGYESIGLLNGPSDSAGSRQHREGFKRAIAGAGLRSSERSSAISRGAAAELTRDWLLGPDRPRAIYATTDEQAFGVLFAAFRLGLNVPADLAVVGFDGTDNCQFSIPPLTTVQQPTARIAARAVELLIGRHQDDVPVHESLPYAFVARGSCGCAD